jgi:hypothetical protein
MEHIESAIHGRLERLGYSSLTDFFLARRTENFFSAAQMLSEDSDCYAPVDMEIALRTECERRDDFSFFARVALFTALTSFHPKGWSPQHYLLAGHWVGMLGAGSEAAASRCWDYLKSLNLPENWIPKSIFDAILDKALMRSFGGGQSNDKASGVGEPDNGKHSAP